MNGVFLKKKPGSVRSVTLRSLAQRGFFATISPLYFLVRNQPNGETSIVITSS